MARKKPSDESVSEEEQQASLPLDEPEESLPPSELRDDLEESPASPETPPEAPPVVGFRDVAQEIGIDLSSFEDDTAALRHLAEQARRASEQSDLAKYGQEYIQHAADFQSYLREKDEAAKKQQAPPDEPKFWDPPEWNPAWLSQLKQDEHGQVIHDPAKGGTPETVMKFHRYMAFRQDQQERFWSDPFSYLSPFIDRAAEKRAQGLIDQRLSEFGQDLDARHFILANDSWLYKRDAAGARQLSEEGQYFAERLREFENDKDFAGMSQKAKEKLALRDLDAFRQSRAAAAQPTHEQKKEATLAKAAGFKPSSEGSATNRAEPEQESQNENGTFVEEMQAAFKEAGVGLHDMLVGA